MDGLVLYRWTLSFGATVDDTMFVFARLQMRADLLRRCALSDEVSRCSEGLIRPIGRLKQFLKWILWLAQGELAARLRA